MFAEVFKIDFCSNRDSLLIGNPYYYKVDRAKMALALRRSNRGSGAANGSLRENGVISQPNNPCLSEVVSGTLISITIRIKGRSNSNIQWSRVTTRDAIALRKEATANP